MVLSASNAPLRSNKPQLPPPTLLFHFAFAFPPRASVLDDFSSGKIQKYRRFLREMSRMELDDTFHSLLGESHSQSQHLTGMGDKRE